MTTMEILKRTKAAWPSICNATAEEKNRILSAMADSLQAENSPFLNRALQSYAVGSVFKPVLAAAALEAGLQPVFECTGAVVVDGQIFRCAGGVPTRRYRRSSAWRRAPP